MSLLGELQNLINEHGSSTILKERISLIQDQVKDIEKKNESLIAERDTLKAENEDLRQQLQAMTVADEFVRHKGVLWLKEAGGEFEEIPYCPKCKTIMTAIPSLRAKMYFHCSQCHMQVNYSRPPES